MVNKAEYICAHNNNARASEAWQTSAGS